MQISLKSTLLLVTTLFVLIAGLSPSYAGDPISQIGIEAGSLHRVVFGFVAMDVMVVKVGSDGWICLFIENDAPSMHIRRGQLYWININQAVISPALKKK